MAEYFVKARFDFSNTPGNVPIAGYDDGQIRIQQADGKLFSKKLDGSSRVTDIREMVDQLTSGPLADALNLRTTAAQAEQIAEETAARAVSDKVTSPQVAEQVPAIPFTANYPGASTPASPAYLPGLFSELLSVARFGALGDGSDQTVKLNTALQAAFECGKSAYFPKGLYVVSKRPADAYCLLNKGVSMIGEPSRDTGTKIATAVGTLSTTDILYVAPQPGQGGHLTFRNFFIDPANGGQRAWVVDCSQAYDVDMGAWDVTQVVCLPGGSGQSLYVVGTRQQTVQGLLSNSTIRRCAFWEGAFLNHIGDGLVLDGVLFKGRNSVSRFGVELEHTNFVLNGSAILSSGTTFRDCVFGSTGGAVFHNGRHIHIINPNAEIGNDRAGATGSNGALFDFRGDVGLIQKVTMTGGQLGVFDFAGDSVFPAGPVAATKFIRVDNVEGGYLEGFTLGAGKTGMTGIEITSNAKYTHVGRFSLIGNPLQVSDAGLGTSGVGRALTNTNGFTNFGSGYSVLACYKDAEGLVQLEGLVNVPASPAALSIATLPVGYRPEAGNIRRVMGQGNASLVALDISPAGTITWSGSTGTNTLLSLEGISFRAAKVYVEGTQTA